MLQFKPTTLFITNQMVDSSDPSNTDTSFKVQLGREVRTKRIVMASCVAENFWCQFQDLSLKVNGILYMIIPDVYLTQATLISFLNSKVGGNIFQYGNTLPVWDTRLELNGTTAFSLIGESWFENLGFRLNVTSNSQIAQQVYSFAQTPYICIHLANLPAPVTNGGVQFTFQLPNSGSFGSYVTFNQNTITSTNSLVLDSYYQFSDLQIVLKDVQGRVLRTPNLSQSNAQFAMTLQLYDE